MKKIIEKHKTLILYALFGIFTTGVNLGVFFIITHTINFKTTIPANSLAWLSSVLFAFYTNKYFVFEDGKKKTHGTAFQLISFFGARLLSGILDIAIVFVFVDILSCNEFLTKILSNVIVIIINYQASKLIIFK